MSDDLLISELRRDEGVRSKAYIDTVGKITAGVGRNLSDVGLSDDEINVLLANDVKRVKADLDRHLPWWRSLDDVRARALANMAFNLGVAGLMGFKDTLGAIQAHRWDAAADAMVDSKWARQVGARALRLAKMIRTGAA